MIVTSFVRVVYPAMCACLEVVSIKLAKKNFAHINYKKQTCVYSDNVRWHIKIT